MVQPAKRLAAFILALLMPAQLLIITKHSAAASQAGGLYYVPITVIERSGHDLYNYSVKVVLNSTNFDGWSYIISENGSDIYFIDTAGNPLYFWVEYFNETEEYAVIWVKIPYIPANSSVTIYMYFGEGHPYTSYRDPGKTFLFFDDFDTLDWRVVRVGGSGKAVVEDGYLKLSSTDRGTIVDYPFKVSNNMMIEAKVYVVSNAECFSLSVGDGKYTPWMAPFNGYRGGWAGWARTTNRQRIERYIDGYAMTLASTASGLPENNKTYIFGFSWYGNKLRMWINYNIILEGIDPDNAFTSLDYIGVAVWDGGEYWVDWIRVRYYVDPEPLVTIGPVSSARVVRLPVETLHLVHELVYSPNSTQFAHSFMAINTTTAGYETSYADAWGWRVWAEPYQSGGTSYENNASLVSEVNITLPYTEVLVKSVALLARTNGTGSFRQLWIRVLNSTGGIVVELINTTIGTGWTEVSLNVNASLSGQITIWINATVKSTASAGEEIAVKDVRVYVEYNGNPEVSTPWTPNVEYFNCSATHYVELGSMEYLNSSAITFKLIEYLTLNATDYPVQPVYVGEETIGSHVYRVYRIEPANYSQPLIIYALLKNKLKTFRIHVKGFDTDTVLVGEPVTIELPEPGNITIVELNETFTNTRSVTLRFSVPGIFMVEANITDTRLWKLGFGVKKIIVKYGSLKVRLVDLKGEPVDYEELVLHLMNGSGITIKEMVGNTQFVINGLCAGNYTVLVTFKDTPVCIGSYELNITTDSKEAIVYCNMIELPTDYRGLGKAVILKYGLQLLLIQNPNNRFPYSRLALALRGSGGFKMYIDYRGDLPTAIRVTSNGISGLKHYLDGNYLVVEGYINGDAWLNITDLYKLRVVLYDRLGNILPSKPTITINLSNYTGSVVEDLLPAGEYLVKIPESISGFEFYSFFDGWNTTTRPVVINHTDVTIKAWYRVPTSVKGLKSLKVASILRFWKLPLLFAGQEDNMARVYVEGYVKDYYGCGVPGRPVYINITDTSTGMSWLINVSTDATGYFRTPLLRLVKGRAYKITIIYPGDDIYLGSNSTITIKPEELPVTYPTQFGVSLDYIAMTAAGVMAILGFISAIRSLRHTVWPSRFVKRR